MKKTGFVIWPVDMKPRHYENLGDIKKDFSQKELEDASMSVVYGCIVVGQLNTKSVLEEVWA